MFNGETEIAGDLLENCEFIRDHLHGVVVGPGCGEEALANRDSILEILEDLPNVETVGVIVSWFANSTELAEIELKPGVEKQDWEVDDLNDKWVVQGLSRSNAYKIRRSDESDPSTAQFGGTIPDIDVLEYFSKIKELGKKAAFYPFIMVDDLQKSWRGFISGDAGDVQRFFDEQYEPFIMHYAYMLYDKVDIFYLGSELQGLTSVKTEDGSFPFVNCLVKLADKVKEAFQRVDVKISYAANWTEYHSCQGGYRPLDELWSNENIDFVGIDYYMPLTNKQPGEQVSLQDIKAGFTSGEGYDYYLDESGDQVPIAQDEPWNRWKDLEYWWESEHWAWDPEREESYKTDWGPGSKLIVFSEFGCPSINNGTNQPYVFKCAPRGSSGEQDIPLQMRAIRATIERTKEISFIENGFVCPYDSRSKGWQEKFVDGDRWYTGRWIDGKMK